MNIPLGSIVAFTASICLYYILANHGHARSQGGRQPAAPIPPVYMCMMNCERWQLSWRSPSFADCLGLRPGSVRLRSVALDLHFSRALTAGLVPRPPLGLSLRPSSRARAPPLSRVTLNCARFAGCWGHGATKKKEKSSRQQGSTLFWLYLHPSRAADDFSRAAILACRLASISLRFLGLAVAVAFLLSTTSLVGPPWPFRLSSLGYEYGTSTSQAAAVIVQHKNRLVTFLTSVSRAHYNFLFYGAYEYRKSSTPRIT